MKLKAEEIKQSAENPTAYMSPMQLTKQVTLTQRMKD